MFFHVLLLFIFLYNGLFQPSLIFYVYHCSYTYLVYDFYNKKNKIIFVTFHPFEQKPPMDRFDQIWNRRIGRRRTVGLITCR